MIFSIIKNMIIGHQECNGGNDDHFVSHHTLTNIPFYLSIINNMIPGDLMECMALTRAEWQKESI